jgi:hypothetical protein
LAFVGVSAMLLGIDNNATPDQHVNGYQFDREPKSNYKIHSQSFDQLYRCELHPISLGQYIIFEIIGRPQEPINRHMTSFAHNAVHVVEPISKIFETDIVQNAAFLM